MDPPRNTSAEVAIALFTLDVTIRILSRVPGLLFIVLVGGSLVIFVVYREEHGLHHALLPRIGHHQQVDLGTQPRRLPRYGDRGQGHGLLLQRQLESTPGRYHNASSYRSTVANPVPRARTYASVLRDSRLSGSAITPARQSSSALQFLHRPSTSADVPNGNVRSARRAQPTNLSTTQHRDQTFGAPRPANSHAQSLDPVLPGRHIAVPTTTTPDPAELWIEASPRRRRNRAIERTAAPAATTMTGFNAVRRRSETGQPQTQVREPSPETDSDGPTLYDEIEERERQENAVRKSKERKMGKPR